LVRLERQLQSKLNQPRIVYRRIHRAKSWRRDVSDREPELWVIKQVEELGSELHPESFGNLRPFEYGEIKVVDAGSAQ